MLPATKLREHESTDAAARRFISKELPDLGGTMHFGASKTETTEKKSKLGVRSVYLKTTYLVRLRSSLARVGSAQNMNQECFLAGEVLSQVQPLEVANRRDGKRQLFAWLHREVFHKLSACAAKDHTFRQWLENYLRMKPAGSGSDNNQDEAQDRERHGEKKDRDVESGGTVYM